MSESTLQGESGDIYVLPTYVDFIRQELCDFMHELSEEHHCASWCDGIEHELWHIMVGTPPEGLPRWIGNPKLSAYELSKLRTLSEAAGGWCTFDGFFPLDEWLTMLTTEEGK